MEEFLNLKVKDVMQHRVWDLPLVEENADIKFVLVILTTRGYVWVVNNAKELLLKGVITEHDALDLFADFNDDWKAKDLMKRNVIYCTKEESVADVINKIKKNKVRRMPVLENGKLIGEITLRLLIEKFYSLLL